MTTTKKPTRKELLEAAQYAEFEARIHKRLQEMRTKQNCDMLRRKERRWRVIARACREAARRKGK